MRKGIGKVSPRSPEDREVQLTQVLEGKKGFPKKVASEQKTEGWEQEMMAEKSSTERIAHAKAQGMGNYKQLSLGRARNERLG